LNILLPRRVEFAGFSSRPADRFRRGSEDQSGRRDVMKNPILLISTGAAVGLLANGSFRDLLDSTWAWVSALFFGNLMLAALHYLDLKQEEKKAQRVPPAKRA
jgi:hypothetical protein